METPHCIGFLDDTVTTLFAGGQQLIVVSRPLMTLIAPEQTACR